ncbi:MAG TPA: NADH-quinone oxidoreductase subunit N, partial [Methanotrichaceae archaeon]|nr:NADH-quinone oxidoreductase subunit N [Methanotrichaceae archaeon]
MDIGHYAPLFPEALLTILAVLIVLLGALIKKSGKLMGILSLVGLLAALGLVMNTVMISPPAIFFFDTISVDGLSQFFKAVFIIVSLLVVIASLSRYTDHPGADEFYALLLFATVGMMVVASSI